MSALRRFEWHVCAWSLENKGTCHFKMNVPVFQACAQFYEPPKHRLPAWVYCKARFGFTAQRIK